MCFHYRILGHMYYSNSNNDKLEYFQKGLYSIGIVWQVFSSSIYSKVCLSRFVSRDLQKAPPTQSPFKQPKKEFRTFTNRKEPPFHIRFEFLLTLLRGSLWEKRAPMMLCPTFRYNFCPLPTSIRRIYFQNICPRRFGLARLLVTDLTSCVDRDLTNLFLPKTVCQFVANIVFLLFFLEPSRANNAPMERFGGCVNVAECVFLF